MLRKMIAYSITIVEDPLKMLRILSCDRCLRQSQLGQVVRAACAHEDSRDIIKQIVENKSHIQIYRNISNSKRCHSNRRGIM